MSTPLRLVEEPWWPVVAPRVTMQKYAHSRFEVNPASPTEAQWLLGLTASCAGCGKPMHPVRCRRGWRTMYLTVAHEVTNEDTVGCARGAAARRAVEDLEAYFAGRTLAETPRLF